MVVWDFSNQQYDLTIAKTSKIINIPEPLQMRGVATLQWSGSASARLSTWVHYVKGAYRRDREFWEVWDRSYKTSGNFLLRIEDWWKKLLNLYILDSIYGVATMRPRFCAAMPLMILTRTTWRYVPFINSIFANELFTAQASILWR